MEGIESCGGLICGMLNAAASGYSMADERKLVGGKRSEAVSCGGHPFPTLRSFDIAFAQTTGYKSISIDKRLCSPASRGERVGLVSEGQ